MNNSIRIYFFILALFIISGCYTMLTHPTIKTTDQEGYTQSHPIRVIDDCSSCHSEPEIVYGNAYYGRDFNSPSYWEQSHSPFYLYNPYYSYPWWYDVKAYITTSSSDKDKTNYEGRLRNQDGFSRGRNNDTRINVPPPTRSDGSTSSGSLTKDKPNDDNKTNSNTNSDSRSNDQGNSKTRNNSGERKR